MRSLEPSANEIVLVTGSSSGIGKACCNLIAENGHWRVYGSSRSVTVSDRWTHVAMDVTDESSVTAAIGTIIQREGRIDAIVHCAGVSLAGSVEDTSIDEAQRQLDTNFFGAMRVVRAALPHMRRQSSGKIILIGSIGGLIGLPYLGYYSASKFALDGLVEALRTELLPFNIQATVVHPGDFNTSFGSNRTYCANANSDSPYFDAFEKCVAFYAAAENNGGSPAIVARRVEKLLSNAQLPVRVIVGAPLEVAGVWAKALLPSKVFEFVFRKAHSP